MSMEKLELVQDEAVLLKRSHSDERSGRVGAGQMDGETLSPCLHAHCHCGSSSETSTEESRERKEYHRVCTTVT